MQAVSFFLDQCNRFGGAAVLRALAIGILLFASVGVIEARDGGVEHLAATASHCAPEMAGHARSQRDDGRDETRKASACAMACACISVAAPTIRSPIALTHVPPFSTLVRKLGGSKLARDLPPPKA